MNFASAVVLRSIFSHSPEYRPDSGWRWMRTTMCCNDNPLCNCAFFLSTAIATNDGDRAVDCVLSSYSTFEVIGAEVQVEILKKWNPIGVRSFISIFFCFFNSLCLYVFIFSHRKLRRRPTHRRTKWLPTHSKCIAQRQVYFSPAHNKTLYSTSRRQQLRTASATETEWNGAEREGTNEKWDTGDEQQHMQDAEEISSNTQFYFIFSISFFLSYSHLFC